MRSRTRQLVLSVIVGSALLAAAACSDASKPRAGADDIGTGASSASEAEDTPRRGGSFTFLGSGSPTPANWDPIAADDTASPASAAPQWQAVFGMLVYDNFEDASVEPYMAKSLEATDASHWVLTLRKGVSFTDGTPYDAEAVKFNWERIADPANGSPVQAAAAQIESMSVVDPLTLEIRLREPNGDFGRVVARQIPYIGSPTALREDPIGFRTRPVGAGPFVLTTSEPGLRYKFTRNEQYWDPERPYLDELTTINIADATSRYNTFASGGGDLMRVHSGYSLVPQAKAAGYRTIEIPSPGGGSGFLINFQKAPFNDVLARRAFQTAIDAERFNETINAGITPAMTHPWADDSPYHEPKARLAQHDPAEAQELIDEYVAKSGGPLRVNLSTTVGQENVLAFFQTQLAQYEGLEISTRIFAGNAFLPALAAGQFDATFLRFSAGDPAQALQTWFGPGGARNYGRFTHPRFEALLREARATTDKEERIAIYAEAQEILAEEVAFFFTGRIVEVDLAAAGVRGIGPGEAHVDGVPLWDRIWLAD